MRLVPILAHLTLLSAIFLFVKRYFGFRPAFVAMSMGAFWLPTSVYASIGRGHELMSLFALTGIFHMYAAIQPAIGLAQYHWKEGQPESIETEQTYRKRERAISYLMSRQPSAVLAENMEAGIDCFLRFRCIFEQQTVRIDVLGRADWQNRYDFVICHPESFPKQLALTDFHPLFQIRQTVVYARK